MLKLKRSLKVVIFYFLLIIVTNVGLVVGAIKKVFTEIRKIWKEK